jgi:hypothetical protein
LISNSTLRAHGLTVDRRASAALFPTRNPTCIATTRSGQRVFVKASVRGDPGVDAERFALRALAGLEGVPELVVDAPGLLATTLLPAGRGRGEGGPIGRALARLQKAGTQTALTTRPVQGDFATRAIWLTPESYAASSKAVLHLLHAAQANDAAANTLAWLIAGEAELEQTAVHGDCRHPNVLIRGERITFVDWEASGRGDPARDIGMLLADDYRLWLAREAHEQPVTRAQLHRRMRALLHGWESVHGGGADEPRRARVAAWLAESLLRNEFSRAHHWHRVNEHVVQTALQLLAQPRAAAEHLFT